MYRTADSLMLTPFSICVPNCRKITDRCEIDKSMKPIRLPILFKIVQYYHISHIFRSLI